MEKLYAVLIAGVVSAIVAFLTTLWKTRAEWMKYKIEVKESYAAKLFEARLNTYPSLYSILSGYSKQIYYGKADFDSMTEFQNQLDEWNNINGILLSTASYSISSRVRRVLQALREHRALLTDDDLETMRTGISGFERALRYEIGIYDIDAVGQFKTFLEVSEELEKRESSIRESANKSDASDA